MDARPDLRRLADSYGWTVTRTTRGVERWVSPDGSAEISLLTDTATVESLPHE